MSHRLFAIVLAIFLAAFTGCATTKNLAASPLNGLESQPRQAPAATDAKTPSEAEIETVKQVPAGKKVVPDTNVIPDTRLHQPDAPQEAKGQPAKTSEVERKRAKELIRLYQESPIPDHDPSMNPKLARLFDPDVIRGYIAHLAEKYRRMSPDQKRQRRQVLMARRQARRERMDRTALPNSRRWKQSRKPKAALAKAKAVAKPTVAAEVKIPAKTEIALADTKAKRRVIIAKGPLQRSDRPAKKAAKRTRSAKRRVAVSVPVRLVKSSTDPVVGTPQTGTQNIPTGAGLAPSPMAALPAADENHNRSVVAAPADSLIYPSVTLIEMLAGQCLPEEVRLAAYRPETKPAESWTVPLTIEGVLPANYTPSYWPQTSHDGIADIGQDSFGSSSQDEPRSSTPVSWIESLDPDMQQCIRTAEEPPTIWRDQARHSKPPDENRSQPAVETPAFRLPPVRAMRLIRGFGWYGLDRYRTGRRLSNLPVRMPASGRLMNPSPRDGKVLMVIRGRPQPSGPLLAL